MDDTAPVDPAEERRRLLHALRLSQRFHLYLVYCDRPRVAASVIEDVKRLVAEERGGAPVVHEVVDFEGLRVGEERYSRRVDQVLLALQVGPAGAEKDARLHVLDASRALAAEREAWAHFFWRLNPTREVVRARMEGELVLVMPSWMEAVFRAKAPDYWTIRSGSDGFWLTPKPGAGEAATGVVESPSATEVDDPIALRGAFLRAQKAAGEALAGGRAEEAARCARDAVAAARARWKGSPELTEALVDLGDALSEQARALEASGDRRGALASAEEAVARGRELLARDPQRVESHERLGAWLAQEASLHANGDDTQAALRAQREAVEHARAAHAARRAEGTARRVIEALLALAALYERHGKAEQARRVLLEALPLLEEPDDAELRKRVEGKVEALSSSERELTPPKRPEVLLLPPINGAPAHATPRLAKRWREEQATTAWTFRWVVPTRMNLGEGVFSPVILLILYRSLVWLTSSSSQSVWSLFCGLMGLLVVLLAFAVWIATVGGYLLGLVGISLTSIECCVHIDASQLSLCVSTVREGRDLVDQGAKRSFPLEGIEAITVVERGRGVHIQVKNVGPVPTGTYFSSFEDARFVAGRLTAAVNHFRALAAASPPPATPSPPSVPS